jgi:hypothetical protein
MKPRFIISGGATLLCLAAIWAVMAQRQQLASLRAEQSLQLAALSYPAAGNAPGSTNKGEDAERAAGSQEASSELLHLRAEVTRLTQRRQALANVRAENDQLLKQVASRTTNAAPSSKLLPGFIRKAEARMVGYNTPQDTLQTFLWAVQNRDTNALLQVLTPESAQTLTSKIEQGENPLEGLWTAPIIGMAIMEQRQMPDGTLEAKVGVTADIPPQPIIFRQINGQWKMLGPF